MTRTPRDAQRLAQLAARRAGQLALRPTSPTRGSTVTSRAELLEKRDSPIQYGYRPHQGAREMARRRAVK